MNCDELHKLAEESKEKIKTVQEQYLKRADEINAMMAEKHRAEVVFKKFYMNLCVRKPTIPTRSDTNQPVQSQKMVRGWKFCI